MKGGSRAQTKWLAREGALSFLLRRPFIILLFAHHIAFPDMPERHKAVIRRLLISNTRPLAADIFSSTIPSLAGEHFRDRSSASAPDRLPRGQRQFRQHHGAVDFRRCLFLAK